MKDFVLLSKSIGLHARARNLFLCAAIIALVSRMVAHIASDVPKPVQGTLNEISNLLLVIGVVAFVLAMIAGHRANKLKKVQG